MKRLLLLLTVGCADNAAEGPHDLGACIDNPWPINGTDHVTIEKCDRACATMPVYENVPCTVDLGLGPGQTPQTFQTPEGQRGICSYDGPLATLKVVFVECQ